jgi:hypothetical protein
MNPAHHCASSSQKRRPHTRENPVVPPIWTRKPPDCPMVLDVQRKKSSNSPMSYRVTIIELARPSLAAPMTTGGRLHRCQFLKRLFRQRVYHRVGRPIVAHNHWTVLVRQCQSDSHRNRSETTICAPLALPQQPVPGPSTQGEPNVAMHQHFGRNLHRHRCPP